MQELPKPSLQQMQPHGDHKTESSDSDSARSNDSQQKPVFIEIRNLYLFYLKDVQALSNIHLDIPRQKVTALLGPSGCGKSSLLRCLNRMNDLIDGCRIKGKIRIDGEDIYQKRVDVANLRRRVGMVFQQPNPFPKTIYDNVAYGLRIQGIKSRRILDESVENALRLAALWDEVKDRIDSSALELSVGQQQRLVMARTIAVEPEILLLDEPASSLDPISTLRIEELINDLREKYTILIVTHNMQQAARVSDFAAFMDLGRLVEFNSTDTLFTNPALKQTEDYITGRYI